MRSNLNQNANLTLNNGILGGTLFMYVFLGSYTTPFASIGLSVGNPVICCWSAILDQDFKKSCPGTWREFVHAHSEEKMKLA